VAESHGTSPQTPHATLKSRVQILSDIVLVLIKLISTNQCSMLANTINSNTLSLRLSRCTTQSRGGRTSEDGNAEGTRYVDLETSIM
jgi:hypothetical protein